MINYDESPRLVPAAYAVLNPPVDHPPLLSAGPLPAIPRPHRRQTNRKNRYRRPRRSRYTTLATQLTLGSRPTASGTTPIAHSHTRTGRGIAPAPQRPTPPTYRAALTDAAATTIDAAPLPVRPQPRFQEHRLTWCNSANSVAEHPYRRTVASASLS
jgi:hypothetical protein